MNNGAHQFVIKYSWKIDYLNCLKDLTGLTDIFYMCPKNFKSFHTFFAEKRLVECKKKRVSQHEMHGKLYAWKARDLWYFCTELEK